MPGPDSADATTPLPQQTVAGRYVLGRILGGGGFGTVYAAHDTLLDRRVAIKLMRAGPDDELSAERFLREARTTARFQHPHVVGLYDAGDDPLGRFLVLELVEGESLSEVLRRGALPLPDAVAIVRQIAIALDAGHATGIVHRDLKPANVLLTAKGDVKLADFGLARLAGQSHLTRQGHIVGTPSYMSPEQIERGEAGSASDIFALGIVFQELLTGTSPFRGGSERETLARIAAGTPDALPAPFRSHELIGGLITSMLHRDPAMRPAAREVAQRLAGRVATSNRWWITAAVIAVLAAAGAGGVWIWRSQRPAAAPVATHVTQTVTLRQPRLRDALIDRHRKNQLGWNEATLSPAGSAGIAVTGPAPAVKNATAALSIVDMLDGADFFGEPNLFTGPTPSKRLLSADFEQYPVVDLIRLIAATVHWPVIIDRSLGLDKTGQPATLTATISDAPWDSVVKTLLERADGSERAEGRLWTLATTARWRVLDSYSPPTILLIPVPQKPESLAALLEPARTERGVIAVNRRLKAVVISDQHGAFGDYARIIKAAGPTITYAESYFAPGERKFTGAPQTLSVAHADIVDVVKLYGRFTGLSMVIDPDVKGSITMEVRDMPWDQTFEAILKSQQLTYTLRQGVMQILPESKMPRDTVIETVKLKNEDPEFFRPFTGTLTPEGSLAIDREARMLVIRDWAPYARAFAQWARNLDAETNPRR